MCKFLVLEYVFLLLWKISWKLREISSSLSNKHWLNFYSTVVGQEEESNNGRHVRIHGVPLLPDEDCGS